MDDVIFLNGIPRPAEEHFWSIRPFAREDRPFTIKTWLRSYEGSAPHSRECRGQYLTEVNPQLGAQVRDSYYNLGNDLVDAVLSRTTTIIACHRTEPDVIVGFITGEVAHGALVVHYIFSMKRYRNMGIARDLLGQLRSELLPQITDSQLIVTSSTPSVRLQIARAHAIVVPLTAFGKL